MDQIKHHFNVYIGVAELSSVEAMEVIIAAALQTFLPAHLKRTVEVVYVETFDADKEEGGGDVTNPFQVRPLPVKEKS